MQLNIKKNTLILVSAFIAFFVAAVGFFIFLAIENKLKVEDPIFSVAWAMLDNIKSEGLSIQSEVTASHVFLHEGRLENLEFLYVNVLGNLSRHPSFNPFSIRYRDFLIRNKLPISADVERQFMKIDEKREVRGLYYRDYLNQMRQP